MSDDKYIVCLPSYDYAFKKYNYRLMMILLYDFTYTQPCGNAPYKRLDKNRYKKYKKEMVKKYKKTERSWNRDFKKMIELGFIKEENDHYKIYNKNPIGNINKEGKTCYSGYRKFSREFIQKLIDDDIQSKEIKSYVLIFYKCFNVETKMINEKHIALEYIAETLGTSTGHHSFRDYIGYRPCEHNYEYEEGCKVGILSKLEELGYIKIRKEKGKCPKGNFNINNYYFTPLLR